MFVPKYYDPRKYRKRYGRYQKFFLVSVVIFFLFALGEIFLYGSGSPIPTAFSVEWPRLFSSCFTLETGFFLGAFLFGITVYAPFFQFVTAALRGVFSAYLLSNLAENFGQKGSVFLFLLVFVYLLSSSFLYFSYSAFCSMVSLRLFSDGFLKEYRLEEKRMFGGVLFNSTFFCNAVNLRFLCMYLIFFLLAFLLTAFLTLSYSFVLSLV